MSILYPRQRRTEPAPMALGTLNPLTRELREVRARLGVMKACPRRVASFLPDSLPPDGWFGSKPASAGEPPGLKTARRNGGRKSAPVPGRSLFFATQRPARRDPRPTGLPRARPRPVYARKPIGRTPWRQSVSNTGADNRTYVSFHSRQMLNTTSSFRFPVLQSLQVCGSNHIHYRREPSFLRLCVSLLCELLNPVYVPIVINRDQHDCIIYFTSDILYFPGNKCHF